jgi:signal transduction histidine kinase
MLEGIVDAGKRAASLHRQLLTFSRRQVVEPRVLDMNAVVIDAERMLLRLIGEDLHLVTVLDPCVKADAGQIGQVIMNLVVNARDAMPTGGTLTIETANVETAGRRLHRKHGAPRRHVHLRSGEIRRDGQRRTAEVSEREGLANRRAAFAQIGRPTG